MIESFGRTSGKNPNSTPIALRTGAVIGRCHYLSTKSTGDLGGIFYFIYLVASYLLLYTILCYDHG
jgi:hypothetical protein